MLLHAPIYYVKVLKFDGMAFTYTAPDGTVITPSMPLPVASVEFTDTLFIPGQSQPGSFALTLHNTKAPEYRYLRPLYNALMFEQRVEIYANESLKGKPVFTGDITEFADELGARQVRGEDARHRLISAKLQAYETLSGNARDLLLDLLKTYQTEFKDDFNRTTGFGADWAFPDGSTSWSITNNHVERLSAAGDKRMHSAATWAAALWQECQIAFDFSFNGIAATGASDSGNFYLYFDTEANEFSIASPAFADGVALPDCSITSNGDNGYSRSYPLDTDNWNHCDIYLAPSTAGKVTGRLFINGIEMLADTFSVTAAVSTLVIRMDNSSATVPIMLDNFEFNPRLPALTEGSVDPTTSTVEHDANGEAQLSALEFICEQLGWEYRINYEAGEGNDTFDAGTGIGSDYSADIVLEDGVNIESLQMTRAVSDLATRLRVYGQSQDEARARAIVSDLDAMDTYGIVLGDCSDPAIVNAATARIVGLSRLTQTAAGGVSISGRIRDEWELYAQSPIWGSAVWGDFIWGGRPRWRPGDYVWLKWEDRAVNRQVRIISMTRKSGDIGLDLTFDYFAWTRAQILERQQIAFARAYRAWVDRNNSPHLEFVSTGAGTVTIYFALVGGILTGVRLDAKVRSGAGNVTAILLDTVDITAALGGFPKAGDFSLDLSSYIRYSKSYSLGFTFAGVKTLDVDLHARVLS